MTPSLGAPQILPTPPAAVDTICDAFEAAWLAGQAPRIEDFLMRADPVLHDVTLRELLWAEWDLCRQQWPAPELKAYLERFSESGELIMDLWRVWTEQLSDRATHATTRIAHGNRLELGSVLAERYVIAASIGSGGMGEVYRAFDSQLDRDVAIKVLNLASLDHPEMQQRFDREVKSVAGLSHPNVVTLYDIRQHKDLTLAVMELIEGITLRQLISDKVRWPVAGQVALGVAEGLASAHARNIMHRDIKPENVMISTNGWVKILDFGLARSNWLPGEMELTGGGFVPGTIPYMSPEQAAGGELTCLTDVFSLGTVLFEMITGSNPFRGDSELATLRNIIAIGPPDVAEFDKAVPHEVNALVRSMIEKESALRPTAKEVATRLRRFTCGSETAIRIDAPAVRVTHDPWTPVVGPPRAQLAGGPPTIAVLPLESLSADSSHRLFGDAIAQEIIVDLSRLHSLFVIARGSSFQFRGPAVDFSQISRVLGAKYVLTGTIEMWSSQSVVAVELAHAPDGRIVWAERFQGQVDDLPALRHTISGQVAAHVESRVHITEVEQTSKLSTECLDAWSAYHRGLWHMYRFNRGDNAIAERMFQLATNKDPFFARAYAGLSFTCFQAAFLRYSDDVAQRRDLARKHAEKSFELDSYDPFANLTMGRSAWLDDRLDDAAVWFDRSLDLRPNYAFAQYNRGFIDALLNNGAESEQRAIKALTLSPIDPLRYAFFGTRALSCLVRGNYAEAATWADKAIREPTAHVHMFGIAAMCHELAGNHDTAKKHAAHIRQMDPDYLSQAFFRSFQFRDSQTASAARSAFQRLEI